MSGKRNDYLSWDEYFMGVAMLSGMRSKDPNTQVGCCIVSQLRSRVRNGCTGCRYCMPCPAGVNIPQNFKIWNNYHMYRTYGHIQRAWENELKQEEKAANCVQCGKCETLCPQKISIRQDLKQVQCDLDSKIFQ